MNCVICHSPRIEMEEVKEEILLDNDVVLIPVKLLVCKNCGERYYNRKTMQFLEKIEENLKKGEGHLKEIGKVLMYG